MEGMGFKRVGYGSDVTDEEWEFVLPYLLLSREDSGHREHDLRAVFNGVRYVARTGCPWRWIRVLTVVDQFTRECLVLFADNALSGEKVATALDKIVVLRGTPESITVDNGSEFASKAMDLWAYKNGVHLDFIRPGKPVENGYIESFNGKLRDECMNVEVFFTLADARRKLHLWRRDYNHQRPHSALADRTPAEFAAMCSSGGKDGGETALENAARFPLYLRTTTAKMATNNARSTVLLEPLT
jgi:putative transposase